MHGKISTLVKSLGWKRFLLILGAALFPLLGFAVMGWGNPMGESLGRWMVVLFASFASVAVILVQIFQTVVRSEPSKERLHEWMEFGAEGHEEGTWDWYPKTGKVIYGDIWSRMLGYTAREVVPNFSFFADRLHPEDRPLVFERLLGHIEGRLPIYKSEHRLLSKSGEWKWVLDRGKVVEWDAEGHAQRVTGLVANITARKEAQEAMEKRLLVLTEPGDDTEGLRFKDLFDLEEIQKIQDAFAEATGVASMITDTQGHPITRPSRFCRLCSDIIRPTQKGRENCFRSDSCLGRMNPQGPIIQPCLSGGLFDGGASICAGDHHIANWLIGQVRDESIDDEKLLAYAREIGADEKEFRSAMDEVVRMPRERFEKIGQALYLIAGQLSRLALKNLQQARDITARKQAEEALKQAKDSAEAANRAKDQFIGVLSHELRTPLTPVLATVAALKEERRLSEAVQADLGVIQRNAELEARLIDDLLDVTRIAQGKLELARSTIDANDPLRNAIEICRRDAEAKWVNLEIALDAVHHHVWADEARLQQVFWNLLNNAIKFTPSGGRISIRTSNPGERLRIEVVDTGIGIEANSISRIFNAFEQGEQTRTRRFGGLGLGLSIARTVMELHQGRLICESRGLDQGALFAAELATVEAPAAVPPHSAEALHAEEKQGRILLVEDHADTLHILTRLLKKWGYTVTTAEDLRTAMERAGEGRFDLLISDLGLPDGSGRDLMRQVKALYGLPGIALSGYGTDKDIQESLEAGFAAHLVKPVNFASLRAELQRIAAISRET